jgi:hypothetical protein
LDSIANPHLNDDPGAIIALPAEIFWLGGRRVFKDPEGCKMEGAEIYWLDEAVICSGDPLGCAWGLKGKTPQE